MSKTIEISRDRDSELEARIVTTGLNTPTGCLVTTIVRYSSSISTTSEFIPGCQYVEDEDGMTDGSFVKIETWDDKVVVEGKDAIENIKTFWKELK